MRHTIAVLNSNEKLGTVFASLEAEFPTRCYAGVRLLISGINGRVVDAEDIAPTIQLKLC